MKMKKAALVNSVKRRIKYKYLLEDLELLENLTFLVENDVGSVENIGFGLSLIGALNVFLGVFCGVIKPQFLVSDDILHYPVLLFRRMCICVLL